MDNLPNLAIVLIYPDGFIETIPITHYKYHMDYLKEHKSKSKRFAELVQDITFDWNHLLIDQILAYNGVISMYNFNVQDIVKDKNFLTYDLPGFQIYSPEYFESLEQLLLIENVILNYPLEKLEINRYDKAFRTLSFSEITTWLTEAKEKLNIKPKI